MSIRAVMRQVIEEWLADRPPISEWSIGGERAAWDAEADEMAGYLRDALRHRGMAIHVVTGCVKVPQPPEGRPMTEGEQAAVDPATFVFGDIPK